MGLLLWRSVLFGAMFVPAFGQQIEGTVIITHKLTKPSVTATAGSYQRGAGVELSTDAIGDSLAFEREHVVVYLEGESASPDTTVSMQQQGRRFVPDLIVIPAGSSVAFPNLDPIFHNVFSLSKPKSFDLGNYPKDQSRTVVFPKPGIIFVHCHLHSNMAGTIVVTPNRWSARVDASGRFAVKDLPAGRYTIVAWHKAAGFFRQNIDVKPGQTVSVQFAIPIGEAGSPANVAQR